MNRPRSICSVLVICALAFAPSAMARPEHPLASSRAFHDGGTVLHGGNPGTAAASRDTVYLLGGPGRLDGRFQDAAGIPNWHGWTHADPTYAPVPRWNVSGYRVPDGGGDLAMWCGQADFPNACDDGYGNGWDERLVFTHQVPDPAVATTVRLECLFNCDSEPGFDVLRIQQNRAGTWHTLLQADGEQVNQVFDQTITFVPDDYAGAAGDELQLRFQAVSDGAWSDEDCSWDTEGLAQVDNIRVTIGGEVFADDFEDGQSHHWVQVYRPGVGDFSHIWTGLQDVDPCASNTSPQVAFIDDGVVVPGTGGTPCLTWCYGVDGYVLNVSGGLAGPEYSLDNLVISPVLAWPADADGAMLSFDAYRHEDLHAGIDEWMLCQWLVRSVATGDPADLAAAPWRDSGQTYAGRGYFRHNEVVTGLLEAGRTHVQVALRVFEVGPEWSYNYSDPTPAPYFDNVSVKAFGFSGPAVSAHDIDLAQDSFPAAGDLDLVNLAHNWVRFDMARNISPADHLRNDPGDSLVVDVNVVRAGAVLEGLPRMIVKMKANPLFDGVRQLPANFTQNDHIVEGWVEGTPTVVANRFAFDLPDSTFFFPGDVIHYYFTAADNVNGNVGVTTLPDKLDGYGNYTGIMAYSNVLTVRALPTLFNAYGDQPEMLFWNDAPDRGRDAQWFYALGNLRYSEHRDYDLYETNGASSGVGNGLGGRATPQTIGGYEQLLYTCGDLGSHTLSNGDFADDPSNDIGMLSNWFQQGGKHAFMTGDDLVSDLTNSGGAGLSFLSSYLSARFINDKLLPLINSQTAPKVRPMPGNSVFTTPDEWLAFGGCPVVNDFDAIETTSTAERLAQFMTPSGDPGYSYAAALRYTNVADVIVMPYDFSFIQNTPGYVPAQPGYTARAEVLRDVLIEFGVLPGGVPIGVPDARTLTVTAGPNPFNPRTTIALDLPRAGAVSLRLYDIRGRLVRTLHDGQLTEGRHELVWFGDDDTGRAMASGVYFYEVRAAGEERIGKLALVR